MKRWAGSAAAALVLGLGLAGGIGYLALQPPPSTEGEIVVEIPRGAALAGVADILESAGVIRSATAFALLARYRGHAGALRAGEYAFAAGLGAGAVLDRLAAGAVMTHRVVVPEGLRIEEVATRIEAAGLGSAAEFLRVAREPTTAAALGIPGASLEGYLFPETYALAKGLPADEIARLMVDHFFAVWREVEPQAAARGLSMHDVVVLASLVEKETAAPEERPLVAAVFLNRLERGMRLETDPAVIYGIADFDGNLRRAHLLDVTNLYNTYQHAGLPPGPIASPGAAALRAVVDPAEADYCTSWRARTARISSPAATEITCAP